MAAPYLVHVARQSKISRSADVVHISGSVQRSGVAIVAAAVGWRGASDHIDGVLIASVDSTLDSSPPGARMIDALRAAPDADGLVLVVDGGADSAGVDFMWCEFESLWGAASMDGRPVGVAAVGSDVQQCSQVLAEMRSRVKDARGLPIGAGLIVDTSGSDLLARTWSGRLEFRDVTAASQLALLGRRVEKLAAARLCLRGQ